MVADTAAIRYRAFLSYSHRDIAWGKWLHGALEGYRIDKDLVRRETPAGPVPKTLRPIFRDREDFSAGHSLTEQTQAALEASLFLVVLCSPNAAQSKYVNEEVRRFKALGRADRVIPVIVDGEPGDAERECFPPALRFKLGPNGQITDEHEEPIAADARPQGDGKHIAELKVVAGLLGLRFDEIVRRTERARKRRNRFWGALAVVFLFLAVAATGSTAYAWQQLQTNEAFLNATLTRATEIVDTAVAQAEKYHVPRSATLELLGKAEGLFDDMARLGRPTPDLRYRKAWMLIQFARNYEILGDSNKQRERAAEAHRLMQGLAEENASNVTFQFDLVITYNELGDALAVQGNLGEALKSYLASLAVAERLVATDPQNTDWQHELAVSYSRVGDVRKAQGNLPEALKSYGAGLAIIERLAASAPQNAGWQRDLAGGHSKIGDVLQIQDNLPEALKSYHADLAILERLAAVDQQNANWQHELSVAYIKVGEVLRAQGDLPEALKSYHAGIAILERLTAADPQNASWQHDLAGSCIRVGDMHKALSDLPEALKNYNAGLAILERLTAADPQNVGWQHDLAMSYLRFGDVHKVQGNLSEALKSYHAGLAVTELLATGDPKNWGRQRDVARSHSKIGDVLVVQLQIQDAIKNYRTALAIMERLVAIDASNRLWQMDVIEFNRDLATNQDDSATRFAFIAANLRKLKLQHDLTVEQTRWLAEAEEQSAKL